jgi:hypothetical protein
MFILKRVPKLDQLGQVFAVISLMISTWTGMWFFWKLRGWIHYLEFGEILTILNYAATVNLLESLVFMLVLVLLCLVLPRKWLVDRFTSRGTALALSSLGYLMYVATLFENRSEYPQAYIAYLSVPVFLIITVFVFLAGRLKFLRIVMEEFADRASIFLYILLPIGLISALIVLGRNLI